MEKVRVYHDREGNSLTVWFDDPSLEYVCEEVDDDVVLMKDTRGRVIGIERLNYSAEPLDHDGRNAPLEVQML